MNGEVWSSRKVNPRFFLLFLLVTFLLFFLVKNLIHGFGDSYEPNSRGPNNSVDSRYRGVLDIELIEYGGYIVGEQLMTRWLEWRKVGP